MDLMFKIDLHVHSVLGGDSDIQPEAVVSRARAAGLDAVCITEHHSYSLSEPFQKISRKANFPIFRGMEYRAAEGHLLVFGVKAGRGELLSGLPMQRVVDWVHNLGGVAVPAHPYQISMTGVSLGDGVLQLKGLIALEAINGSVNEDDNLKAMAAAARLGIQGIGGSDAHGIKALGKAYTIFPEPIKTMEGLVMALRSGGYTPYWNGNGTEGDQILYKNPPNPPL
jgi:predicted metal-dependent phosphoesterase TrpH